MRPCQPKVVFVRMFQAASSGSVALGDVTVGGEPGAPGVGELAVAAAAPEALASPGWAAAAAVLLPQDSRAAVPRNLKDRAML